MSGTPLILAASAGNIPALKLLLDYGADVGMPGMDSWTALHVAADKGYLAVVELLLEHGACPIDISTRGMTALHRASGRGTYRYCGALT
jgi:ankyrin repeat protein